MEEALVKRILPHSIRAEKAVIGSMIMDADAIATASEMITGDDFYQRQNTLLFHAMVELTSEGKPVDLITLQENLKMKDVPDELCSIEFISELVNQVPTLPMSDIMRRRFMIRPHFAALLRQMKKSKTCVI